MRTYGVLVSLMVVAAVVVGGSAGAVRIASPGISAASGQRTAIAQAPFSAASPASQVTIAGTAYYVVNARYAIGFIPSPYAKAIARLLAVCGASGAYGFWGSKTEVGVVAWLPRNPKLLGDSRRRARDTGNMRPVR
jgi:hypothetical protein